MAIAELLVKSALGVASSVVKNALEAPRSPDLDIEGRVANHISKIALWSGNVQNFFMAKAVETDNDTVSLSIDGIPRRFRGGQGTGEPLKEKELLQKEQSFILLGGPGAGKTTTLKRLARQFVVALEEQVDCPWRSPILVIVREASEFEPIDLAIARSLDLPIMEPNSGSAARSVSSRLSTAVAREPGRPLHDGEVKAIIAKSRDLRIGSASVKEFIVNLLNEIHALVLLDGIDELPASSQPMIWQSIGELNSRLATAKIIATCRTGDFSLSIEGISVCEIEPLTLPQITEIARRSLPDYETFLNLLSKLPYADTAAKPLFLSYMLTLYRYQHRLPERPRHVYQRIVSCALEEWDRSKNLARPSRYAEFNSDEKLEFLAHLAYHLTYTVRSKRFSRSDLEKAYLSICGAFQLPENQAEDVAHELETHTGVIVDSGYEQFEFSHLSIQEYLCAYYLVRNPHCERMTDYLEDYPAPVAIAAALSSDATNWLTSTLLGAKSLPSTIGVLLERLVDERPYFTKSEFLGLGILRILFLNSAGCEPVVQRLLSLPNVNESIASALSNYRVVSRQRGVAYLKLRGPRVFSGDFTVPDSGALNKQRFEKLLDVKGSA